MRIILKDLGLHLSPKYVSRFMQCATFDELFWRLDRWVMAGFHPQMYRLFLRQSSLRVACQEIVRVAASPVAHHNARDAVSAAVKAGACVRVCSVSFRPS